jgi:hypothetical protein
VYDRIQSDHGRLDLAVNVASPDFSEMIRVAFWDIPFHQISACLDVGPRSNYVTTALAARIMVSQGSRVVINIESHGAEQYLLSVPYGVGKGAIDKLTRDTASELRAHGVAVVSVWPGLVLTEGLLSHAEVAPDGTRTLHGLDIGLGETPKFNGRAVVALASDPAIIQKKCGSFWSSRLAPSWSPERRSDVRTSRARLSRRSCRPTDRRLPAVRRVRLARGVRPLRRGSRGVAVERNRSMGLPEEGEVVHALFGEAMVDAYTRQAAIARGASVACAIRGPQCRARGHRGRGALCRLPK